MPYACSSSGQRLKWEMSICSYMDENTRWSFFSDGLWASLCLEFQGLNQAPEGERGCWDLHLTPFPYDNPMAHLSLPKGQIVQVLQCSVEVLFNSLKVK